MNSKSTLSPCFTSKKVDDKSDIFTSRWEETHLYMIDLMWVCLSCGTETTSQDFYSSEVRKTLEKIEKPFFQQIFWKALLRSPLPWSLPVLLGLWTCLGKDGLFFCFCWPKGDANKIGAKGNGSAFENEW